MATPRPSRPDQGPESDPPSVQTRRCPTCGHDPAVVFKVSQAADGKALPRPREVCLACCPNAPGDS